MKVVKYLWVLSLFGYLAVALFVYADANEPLNLHFDAAGQADFALKKQVFFYYSLGALVLINGLVLLLANAAAFMNMPLRSRWQADKPTQQEFAMRAKEWVRGFAWIANLLLMVIQVAVYNINSDNNFHVTTFAYAIAILFVGWLLAYISIFKTASSPNT